MGDVILISILIVSDLQYLGMHTYTRGKDTA